MPFISNNSHTGLLSKTALGGEAIRLRHSLGAVCGPLVNAFDEPAVDRTVGGQHLDEGAGPEPAVNVKGLVVGGVTSCYLQKNKDFFYFKIDFQ